ncbi:peptidase inhibitor family I36 protein [Streptomyces sp. NPDC052036]|uniref:peptidase inhibitor family I36 protein n=1 Tax=unclassified Streptomyces TaxID=2593676 RepID=UPI0034216CF8
MLVTNVIRKSAVLAASLVLLTAPAAAAAPTRRAAEPCAIEHLCLYSRGQMEGAMASYTKGARNTALQNLPKGGWSVWNRTSEEWCLWYKTDYEGGKEVVRPGKKVLVTSYGYKSLLPRSDWRC